MRDSKRKGQSRNEFRQKVLKNHSLLDSDCCFSDDGCMSNLPPKKNDKEAKALPLNNRAAQFEEQRRREMATRSILSRFKNRKSPKK